MLHQAKIIGMTILMTMVLLMSSLCFAKIPSSQFALGGITLGCDTSYVRNIYGAPNSVSTIKKGYRGFIYTYGSTFYIWFYDSGSSFLIGTKGNNGIATPAGITVGMNSSILWSIYGSPDKLSNGTFIYFGDNGEILVIGTKNNKIISMNIGWDEGE